MYVCIYHHIAAHSLSVRELITLLDVTCHSHLNRARAETGQALQFGLSKLVLNLHVHAQQPVHSVLIVDRDLETLLSVCYGYS